MKIIIRDADYRDAEKLDALLTKLIQDEVQYDVNLNGEYVVQDNYRERLGLDGHKAFVAEVDGRIVGYLYGFLWQLPGIHCRSVAILDALYVEEAYRRLGCARRLFAEFQKFARERGAYRIELKVLSENEKALALYRGLSFAETKKYMCLDL